MAEVRVCHLEDERQFAALREFFEQDNPGLRLTCVEVDGPSRLQSEHGGMRVFWIYRGQGEVFLPIGYRTQEGDGPRLPSEYQADPIAPEFAELLSKLEESRATLSAAANVPVAAILGRRKGATFVGDYAGELWKLDHVARPWSR